MLQLMRLEVHITIVRTPKKRAERLKGKIARRPATGGLRTKLGRNNDNLEQGGEK